MPSAKLAAVSSLAAVALAGCGTIHVKPVGSKQASRGVIDDPRTHLPNRVACLRQDGLTVRVVGSTRLQIGTSPSGASVTFTPTAGAAQTDQIEAIAPGAEVIGSALLYPHRASDADLKKVEDCLSKSVTG